MTEGEKYYFVDKEQKLFLFWSVVGGTWWDGGMVRVDASLFRAKRLPLSESKINNLRQVNMC